MIPSSLYYCRADNPETERAYTICFATTAQDHAEIVEMVHHTASDLCQRAQTAANNFKLRMESAAENLESKVKDSLAPDDFERLKAMISKGKASLLEKFSSYAHVEEHQLYRDTITSSAYTLNKVSLQGSLMRAQYKECFENRAIFLTYYNMRTRKLIMKLKLTKEEGLS